VVVRGVDVGKEQDAKGKTTEQNSFPLRRMQMSRRQYRYQILGDASSDRHGIRFVPLEGLPDWVQAVYRQWENRTVTRIDWAEKDEAFRPTFHSVEPWGDEV